MNNTKIINKQNNSLFVKNDKFKSILTYFDGGIKNCSSYRVRSTFAN